MDDRFIHKTMEQEDKEYGEESDGNRQFCPLSQKDQTPESGHYGHDISGKSDQS